MNDRNETLQWLPRFVEFLLASLMVYSCIMHFKFAQFVAGIVPAWMPWRLFWAYFTGVALCVAGISIIVRRLSRLAATLLGVLLLLFVLLIHTPSMVSSIIQRPGDINVLWSFNGTGGVNNFLKDVSLVLAAFLVTAKQSLDSTFRQWSLRILGALFAGIMALFGVEHFFYTSYTPGIPSWSFVSFWIPWRLFWGYLTGALLLCGGVLILIGKSERDAAAMLGATILSVAATTYLFRMAAHLGNYSELTNTMKDVAVAGGAFILGGTFSFNQRRPAIASEAVDERG